MGELVNAIADWWNRNKKAIVAFIGLIITWALATFTTPAAGDPEVTREEWLALLAVVGGTVGTWAVKNEPPS